MITVTTNSKKISKACVSAVKKVLKEHSITEGVVDIAIVNKEKMEELNDKFYKDKIYEHPIFTFPESVTTDNFVFPPDGKKYLGQIVILETTKDEILKLAIHGSLHLVGIHH